MSAPIDKREYLASLNPPLAIAGARGKFSKQAHEALKAAEAAGVVFLEKGAATATVTRIVDGEAVTETRMIDPFAPTVEAIRSGTLTFKNGKDTIKVNSSEACVNCSMSFGWCYCATPTFRYWKTGEVYSLNG